MYKICVIEQLYLCTCVLFLVSLHVCVRLNYSHFCTSFVYCVGAYKDAARDT